MTLDPESLRAFVKVVELGSFTRAAAQLGTGKARVSLRIKALEDELGTRLLQRTTRVVRATSDGEELLPRARRWVLDGEELGALFQTGRGLRGLVRVDLPVRVARDTIIPRLPELLARHPALSIHVSTTDRRTAPVREGFDLVLRVGAPGDPSLVGRRLGMLAMANAASPEYVRRHGVPRTLADLARHLVVHYASPDDTAPPSFEHVANGVLTDVPVRSVLTVSDADAYYAACMAGLGIVQAPRAGLRTSFASGLLIEVLPEHLAAPMPVSLLHPHGRSVPRRVRAVMSWLEEIVGAWLASGAA